MKKRDPALSQAFTRQNSSQSKSRKTYALWDICRERVDVEGVAEGMGLQSERVVLISETPSPVFFCPFGDINSRLR